MRARIRCLEVRAPPIRTPGTLTAKARGVPHAALSVNSRRIKVILISVARPSGPCVYRNALLSPCRAHLGPCRALLEPLYALSRGCGALLEASRAHGRAA